MSGLFTSLWGRVPAPWRLPAGAVLFVLFVAALFGAAGRIQSCGYDRGRAEFEAERKAWASERATLEARIAERDRRIGELEPQVQAFQAAAEAGKRVDEQLAQKIEAVAKESADAEANAQVPVDCRVRARRLCDMFRSGDARFDCRAIFAECG